MKKRMLVLGGLMAATALTAYSVSGTYAKYISGIELTDEARVAKWAFNTEVKVENLFAESYSVDGEVDGSGAKYVQSLTPGEDVVAPGTSGSYKAELSAKGVTEVAYKYSILYGTIKDIMLPEGTFADGLELDNDYYPIKYTVKITDKNDTDVVKISSSDINANQYDGLSSVIEKAVDAFASEINSKTGNSIRADDEDEIYPEDSKMNDTDLKYTFEISWSWAFEQEVKSNGVDVSADRFDTILGLLMNDPTAVKYEGNETFAARNGSTQAKIDGLKFVAEQITATGVKADQPSND